MRSATKNQRLVIVRPAQAPQNISAMNVVPLRKLTRSVRVPNEVRSPQARFTNAPVTIYAETKHTTQKSDNVVGLGEDKGVCLTRVQRC